jgi:type I restriction enzyme M protein
MVLQSAIPALASFTDDKLLSRDKFKKQFTKALGDVKLPAPVFKLLVNHLAEQDDAAEGMRTKGERNRTRSYGITRTCR